MQHNLKLHHWYISGMAVDEEVHMQRSRPQQQYQSSSEQSGQQSTANALFSSLKGGAGSLMKNIKDASAKVMETVSA